MSIPKPKPTPGRPQTPCIGICSTALGDEVCRGCKRFAEEVVRWNAYSGEERFAVYKRLDNLLVQSVQIKFLITDAERLQQKIRYQQIEYRFDQDPYCWLYDLLRQGAGQIKQLNDYGARVKPEWRQYTLVDLKEKIDGDYYERSVNYFRRYILPAESALKNSASVLSESV